MIVLNVHPLPASRRWRILLLLTIMLSTAAGCEPFMASQAAPAKPAPRAFILVGEGDSEAEVKRRNGVPDRREQRGDTDVWTYIIELEHGVTTGVVEFQGGIVTRSEARFVHKTEGPPVPRPVAPPE